MNIAARGALVAAATVGAGALAWKLGNATPEPVDDGITRRELAPALGATVMIGAGGAIFGPAAWLLLHAHEAPGLPTPKVGAAILVGATIGLAFGAGFGFGLANSENYNYPVPTQE